MTALFDPEAVCAPLLAASPGSQVISTCGLCGQRVRGPVGLYGNGFVRHPDDCPPPPPYVPPPGMLL